ncbi:hypothetical protein F383_16911 [Gossypium arboreum]|uniref:Uncharacterized protein n=1 Tax=Gossypium arboreum TaxID=29729 RepID=A0A0B0NH87_GOSAR|nr:hypothetical protein F383_16911 [Gossypium arboreum]
MPIRGGPTLQRRRLVHCHLFYLRV